MPRGTGQARAVMLQPIPRTMLPCILYGYLCAWSICNCTATSTTHNPVQHLLPPHQSCGLFSQAAEHVYASPARPYSCKAARHHAASRLSLVVATHVLTIKPLYICPVYCGISSNSSSGLLSACRAEFAAVFAVLLRLFVLLCKLVA